MNVSKELWETGVIEVNISGLREDSPFQKALTLDMKDYPLHEIIGINYSFAAKEFSPDYYDLKLQMKDGKGSILDEKTANFIISPAEGVPHPVTMTKSFPLSNYYLFVYSLANQYDRAGTPENAESFYEKAFSLNPDYTPGMIEYAHFLLKIRKYQKCLNLIENAKRDENLRFEYFLVKGQAFMGMEKYFTAIENFLEGNKIYDSDIRLLNSLGYSFYKTGDKQRALEALRSSVRLDPEQQDVIALIQEIEKEQDVD